MPLPPASLSFLPLSAIVYSMSLTASSSWASVSSEPGTGTFWNRRRLSWVRTPCECERKYSTSIPCALHQSLMVASTAGVESTSVPSLSARGCVSVRSLEALEERTTERDRIGHVDASTTHMSNKRPLTVISFMLWECVPSRSTRERIAESRALHLI